MGVAKMKVLWATQEKKPPEQPLINTADWCHRKPVGSKAAQCAKIKSSASLSLLPSPDGRTRDPPFGLEEWNKTKT